MLNNSIKVDLNSKNIMNENVTCNFSKLKLSSFFLPLILLIAIVLFLYSQDALNVINYIQVQKDCFFFINSKLSQFPNTAYNLTQIGDTLIFLSFLSIFILYVPKIWESLLSALLVSAVFSNVLKKIFAVPRPAAMFDNDSFVIIGKTLTGHNSLPSGHSITIFTVLSVLMFAFMPRKLNYKILWCFLITALGLLLVSTRVAVGAHFPLDVTIGSIFGYISGISGIFINQKYKIWFWINDKKFYPFFILLFTICSIILITKIINENLIIFYFALISLIISLYKITSIYVKK
jgi:membrane-associated phospholipid phosphatase